MGKVTFVNDVKAKNGEPLMKILKDEKTNIIIGCKGKGKCLKCLCTAEGQVSEPSKREVKLLGDKKIKKGVRLACEVIIEGDATIKRYKK